MPKPDKAAEQRRIEAAQAALAEAKERRDEAKAAADREFWTVVRDAIESGELKQIQACEAIGYQREYVRRQLLALKTDQHD